ncbi:MULTISPECIES: FtsK/SpoIIIE domain-containing protein [Thermomonospora]|uniref:Cell divisionFtsK/SpoIIIE n=1 Tax=Thermomonospora curvata (strain ATCC 19995 / DSM 43183 / JCM 3096 / KCTC 9072 / NBRC 15933 / NCIMB 10081 / Henssen B9) TaxID=471852 RepID=D1A572_THECD|nr:MULTISPECIES: FtsK/SpoIIIE domain-containing protein [Thermomonospora]ACZ00058.1 cell divisionFtsK/SpoIIIE [Thermomonospora curvata DSM 43183]PKK11894.1 MAG: cell division protein FtsK [Thermomonospora sp. CIF 1]
MNNLALLIPALAALVAVGSWVWRHWHPASFWYGAGYPFRLALVYLTWAHVAAGCGLSRTRRRWRWTLDAVPVAGSAARSVTVATCKRRWRRVDVERAPRLGWLRPTRLGWRVRVRLHDGQVPADYERAAEGIAHAWRVHSVRVADVRPGQITLWATMRDPLTEVRVNPDTGRLLTVRPGKLDNGSDWIIDFRTVPHWLNAGATQSGKSNLANAIIKGLAPQPVALVGFDLKGGVEFTPYAPRLSALATTRPECLALLGDLVGEVEARMALCRVHGVRNVWHLPDHLRPVPVVVLVDEVAELFLMADRAEKDQVAKTGTALLRLAQLGRAFAVHLVICGQRIGSDLGPGVTALRSQLSGRICHRVNDPETATMTLGDLDPAALDAARTIPAQMPGVCIVAGQDGTWHRARSVYVPEHEAEHAAHTYAHLTPSWADLTSSLPAVRPAVA